jgi:uncharacterized protein YecE (DUF72 family)
MPAGLQNGPGPAREGQRPDRGRGREGEQRAGLAAFLQRLEPFLDAWPKGVPVAVEVRNKTWLNPKLTDCLRARRVVLVLADHVWMPSPLEVLRKLDAVTGAFAYARLLGDRNVVDALTPTLDHVVIDRSDQLRADAEAIRQLADRVRVFVYVNNPFAGYAPATVEQLRQALGLPG